MGNKLVLGTAAALLLLALAPGQSLQEPAGAGRMMLAQAPPLIDTGTQGGVQHAPDMGETPGQYGSDKIRTRGLKLNRRGAPKAQPSAAKKPAEKDGSSKSKND